MSGFIKTIISSVKGYLCLLLVTFEFVMIKQFSADMDDFHGVSSNVRRIRVQIKQKKTLYTVFKMLSRRGGHNDPRLLKFSTQIL